MNITLIGYGRMGKEIEKVAIERGHSISGKIEKENSDELPKALQNSDAAIEFTHPESAVQNMMTCFEAQTPVIVGTTGWNDHLEKVISACNKKNSTLFYASNFSVGVNLFMAVNKYLAKLMNDFERYNVSMEEIHHIHKLDAPSGTAITLAEQILENIDRKDKWVKEEEKNASQLAICSKREGEVPGTHRIFYESEIDDIEITHKAKNRKGFALGSVLAAEFVEGKTGVFGMQDLLNL